MGKIIRHCLLVLFVFSLLSFVFPIKIFSQSTPESATDNNKQDLSAFDQSFQDYLSKFDEYNVARQDYILKRAQYLRFGTLKSREDAQKATLAMLQKRDIVIIYFIKTLKERLKIAIGVGGDRLESLNVRLSEEMAWFENHKDVMTSAGSLDDLTKDSDKAKERYASFQPLVYEVLATISLGKLTDFSERISDSYFQIKGKVDEIKKEERDEYKLSEDKTQRIDRWLFESNNRIIRGQEKQAESDGKIADLGRIPSSSFGEYNNALTLMGETQLFYKEAGSFLKEVIREIKIKD